MKKIIVLILLLFLLGSFSIVSSNCKESKELDNLIVLSIEEAGDPNGYIFVYDIGIRELNKISTFSGYDPSWDSTKEKIVFNTDREYDPFQIGNPSYNPDIYVINKDGTGEKRLTNNKRSFGQTVCEFNNHINYMIDFIDEAGKIIKIYSMDLYGNNKKEIFESQLDITNLNLSPDDKEIVFSTYDSIYKYSINNSRLEKLKEAEKTGIYYNSPKYSPNGDEILYFKSERTFTKMGIYVMDRNGENRRKIVSNMATYEAAWSPDGKKIIFMTKEGSHNGLYIVNKDGTSLEEIKLPLDKPYRIYGIDW